MKPLFGGLDLLDFNNEFLNKHKFSLPHQLAGKLVYFVLFYQLYRVNIFCCQLCYVEKVML
jgi:hypothetical protein